MAKTPIKNKANHQRNIFILISILLIIFLILYFFKWHQVNEESKYINSYLLTSKTISQEMNDLNEIDNVLLETPDYYFVYISYTEDKKVYNNEKKLKPLIEEYDLQDKFYFINVTDIKKNNANYLEDIASKLNISKTKIPKVPIILFFKDNTLVGDGVYNAKDFEKLLEENDIKSL